MRWILLFCLVSCTSTSDDADPPPDTGSPDTGPRDTGVSFSVPSYATCSSAAQCPPGDACTTVPGYAGRFCAPPCDPIAGDTSCDTDGSITATCLPTGRCVQTCSTDCPVGLECIQTDGWEVCAGEPNNAYQTCLVDPTTPSPGLALHADCPGYSACLYFGDLFPAGVGACMPWCEHGTCPHQGLGIDAAPQCLPLTLFPGIDNCALFCDPESEEQCPPGLACGSTNICLPASEGGR